jgi:hypothetical protein
MKKFSYVILVSLISTFVMAFTTFQRMIVEEAIELEPPRPLVLVTPTLKTKINIPKSIVKNHDTFLDAIGFRESSNRYDVVNRYGYMGKYQFAQKTLNKLGIDIPREEFLNNPQMQEQAMYLLLRSNYQNLKKYIDMYEGKVLHGILVTKSGVLAAAHLGGAGNVRKWFKKGQDFKDGNGTKITNYMVTFAGYNLRISTK